VARIAKVVVDGDLSRKLNDRIGWAAQDRAAMCTALLAAIVEASPLSAQQRLAVWESRFDGLQMVADGRAPARMLGDATAGFTERLQVAAAEEKAVAEGVPWGDSEPDLDADSDRVPLLFAIDDSGNGWAGGGGHG
jgi:hypothetical protein